MKSSLIRVLMLLLLNGCGGTGQSGPVGPVGPQGPPGPVGPQGPPGTPVDPRVGTTLKIESSSIVVPGTVPRGEMPVTIANRDMTMTRWYCQLGTFTGPDLRFQIEIQRENKTVGVMGSCTIAAGGTSCGPLISGMKALDKDRLLFRALHPGGQTGTYQNLLCIAEFTYTNFVDPSEDPLL